MPKIETSFQATCQIRALVILNQAILTTRSWEFLEIPGDKDLVTVVAFGYPADWVAAGAKVRDILSETAHNERVGQTYEG